MDPLDSSNENPKKIARIGKRQDKASASSKPDAPQDISDTTVEDISSPSRSQITFAAADYISLLHTTQFNDTAIVGKLISQLTAEYTSSGSNSILEHMPNQDLQFHMLCL